MAQNVDRRRKQDIAAGAPELAPHHRADPLLNLRLPGGAPGNTDRKRSCAFHGGDASWTVGHHEGGNTQALYARRAPEQLLLRREYGAIARHLRDFLFERHLREELVDAVLEVIATGVAARNQESKKGV